MTANIPDATFLAEIYFRYLKHLIRHDELPPEIRPDVDAWLQRDRAP